MLFRSHKRHIMKIDVGGGGGRSTVAQLSGGLVCGFEGGGVVEEGGARSWGEGGGSSEEGTEG